MVSFTNIRKYGSFFLIVFGILISALAWKTLPFMIISLILYVSLLAYYSYYEYNLNKYNISMKRISTVYSLPRWPLMLLPALLTILSLIFACIYPNKATLWLLLVYNVLVCIWFLINFLRWDSGKVEIASRFRDEDFESYNSETNEDA